MSIFWPADPATITEEAGTRGGEHYGIDFGVPEGTPLIAPFDGVVVDVFTDGAEGELWPGSGIWANGPALILDIQRADGLLSRFAHLSGVPVTEGTRVRAGDHVAWSGNTGFTTGDHLHWELRWDRALGPGAWINPREFNPQIYRNEDIMTPEQEKKLDRLIKDVTWLKSRVGGTSKSESISQAIQWVKKRIGGTDSTPNLTDRVRGVESKLHPSEESNEA